MDRDIVNNIKSLSLDMISNAGSGNSSVVLSSALIMYTIYSRHLVFNPSDTSWVNRDRFILSSGSISSAFYSTLFLSGYNLTIEDLKNYKKTNKTSGYPEYNLDIGIETTTGPTGISLATSIGIALAGKINNEKFNLPKKSKLGKDRSLIDYNVYVLVSSDDLIEGITYEAASLAGTLKLSNLIVLYDSNNICWNKNDFFTENVIDRFKSMGWFTETVKDGMSINDIDKAIIKAKESNLPSFIEIKTITNDENLFDNTNKIYNGPLTDDELKNMKKKLNIPNDEFYVNYNSLENYQNYLKSRNNKKYEEWKLLLELYKKNNEINCEKLIDLIKTNDYFNLPDNLKVPKNNISTYKLCNYYMNLFFSNSSNTIVGTSNLSNKFVISNGTISSDLYNLKNMRFKCRENLMSSVLNGLALCNFNTFGETPLIYSDYLRPSLRQTCMMKLPVTYLFTNDTLNNNYEGSPLEPVEQFSALSCIPNLFVFRPCDGKELIGSIYKIMNSKLTSCIILSNKDSKQFEHSSLKGTIMGGYIIKKEIGKLQAIIISSGTEVELAINISNEIYEKYKVNIRVVSIPCLELFKKQSKEYLDSVIPKNIMTIVINSSTSYGFDLFVYDKKYLITLNSFGISATNKEQIKYMKLDYDSVYKKVEDLLFK